MPSERQKFAKTARIKTRLTRGIADGFMAVQTIMTFSARDMMGTSHPMTPSIFSYASAYLFYHPANLMTQDQRHSIFTIPLHHIATADTGSLYPD